MSIFDHVGTRNRSEKRLAAHSRVLDVNSKTNEGCKLQVPCHAQSPGTQSLLAPPEQVLPRTGIPSSAIQYLGKEIQRAASTASSLLLAEKPSRLVVGTGEGMGQRCL